VGFFFEEAKTMYVKPVGFFDHRAYS